MIRSTYLKNGSFCLYFVRAVKKHLNEAGLANIGGLVGAQTFSQSRGGHRALPSRRFLAERLQSTSRQSQGMLHTLDVGCL